MNALYKQVFNKYNVNLDSAYSLSDEIVDMLEKVAPKNTAYNIITDTPNFRYLQLGLEPKNIYQTFGLLDPEILYMKNGIKKLIHLNLCQKTSSS